MKRWPRLLMAVLGASFATAAIAATVSPTDGDAVIILAQATTTAPATTTTDPATTAEAPAAGEAAPLDEAAMTAMMESGKTLYDDVCASCHAVGGKGDIGPKLIGNAKLKDPVFVHKQIKNGGSEMPAMSSYMSEEEILAVGTYVRNAWGNDYGPLTPENVVAQ